MNTMTTDMFDILDFVNKSKELGVDERVAQLNARQIDQLAKVIEQRMDEQRHEIEALKLQELCSKGDLRESELRLQKEIEIVRKEIEIVRKEVAQTGMKTVVWVSGIMGTLSVFFLGILAKGFHWL